jgi:hypothetical protein
MDTNLASYATVRQLEYLEAVEKHGTEAAAARSLGVNPRTLQKSLRALEEAAARKGHAPAHDMTHTVPEGFRVKGASTLYDEDGKVRLQWVKSTATDEYREQALRDFADSLAQGVAGLAPIAQAPEHVNDDLLCVYPMGDPHFGLYAWAADAGDDFDLDIAEQLTKGAIDQLVSTAPNAATAILLNLGDMFHMDSQGNTTTAGTRVDVDGRRPKVQQIGLMAMVHAIMRLREKHGLVIYRQNKGNHDEETSYALSMMLACWFRDDPRVIIELSPAIMWYYRFGKVLLGSTHGNTIKGKDMIAVMACDKPEDWGATRFRHCLVGHVHHHDSKEYPGGIVEYFNTLAARDAWHQGQGYRAGRDMRLIVYHRDHGEIARHRCDVSMLS